MAPAERRSAFSPFCKARNQIGTQETPSDKGAQTRLFFGNSHDYPHAGAVGYNGVHNQPLGFFTA